MTQSALLADQIRRSVFGDAWHGPSILENLEGVSGGDRIEQIVRHATVWMRLAKEAIEGKPIPEWPFPEDWEKPTGQLTPAIENLKSTAEACAAAVAALPDNRLSEIVPGRDHAFYYLLSGIAQHNGYHGGQIALLKKK